MRAEFTNLRALRRYGLVRKGARPDLPSSRVIGFLLGVWGLGLRLQGVNFKIEGFGFHLYGLGSRVWSVGLTGKACKA